MRAVRSLERELVRWIISTVSYGWTGVKGFSFYLASTKGHGYTDMCGEGGGSFYKVKRGRRNYRRRSRSLRQPGLPTG